MGTLDGQVTLATGSSRGIGAELGPVRTVVANLLTTFLALKSFLPGMKERRAGCVVTVSSAAGRRAGAQSPVAYSAAKAGIALLTQQVAQQALAVGHPLQRLGTPQDAAGWITGVVLDVAGGAVLV
jgi:3-oxoacyl-[acyl-carrier protein] reductase